MIVIRNAEDRPGGVPSAGHAPDQLVRFHGAEPAPPKPKRGTLRSAGVAMTFIGKGRFFRLRIDAGFVAALIPLATPLASRLARMVWDALKVHAG